MLANPSESGRRYLPQIEVIISFLYWSPAPVVVDIRYLRDQPEEALNNGTHLKYPETCEEVSVSLDILFSSLFIMVGGFLEAKFMDLCWEFHDKFIKLIWATRILTIIRIPEGNRLSFLLKIVYSQVDVIVKTTAICVDVIGMKTMKI